MSSVFYTLAILACPVGMGLMMYIMMRGQDRGSANQYDSRVDRAELDALRAEIETLKAKRAGDSPEHPQP
jgi:hypothetical protein